VCRAALATLAHIRMRSLAPSLSTRALCTSRMRLVVCRAMLPPRIKAVLFDIDGTLTHSDDLHLSVFREVLQELGYDSGRPIDAAFFKARISGRHNPEIFADLFPSLSAARHEELAEDKEARFRALATSSLRPLPGLREFAEMLQRRGVPVAAVTNAPRLNVRNCSLKRTSLHLTPASPTPPQAELMLRSVGLEAFFGEQLVIGAECTRAKPAPDPYLEGLRRLGVSSCDAIAFEDSPSGLQAAVAAGLATVGILTTQEGNVLLQAGAAAVVYDFRDELLWNALGEPAPKSFAP